MAHTRNARLNLLPTFWQLGSHRDTTKQVAEQRCKNNAGKSSGTCSLRRNIKRKKNLNRLINQQKSKHLVMFCIHIFVSHGKKGGVDLLCSQTAGVAVAVVNAA